MTIPSTSRSLITNPSSVSDMNRRRYLCAIGGTGLSVAIAGCADETDDTDPGEEPDVDDGDDPQPDDEPSGDGLDETDDDPVLEILDVDAPATVEQGETLEVTVTVETSPPASVSTIIGSDGDILAEDTGRVDEGEHSLTLELEILDDVDGEKTLEIEADNGEETISETQSIEIESEFVAWESYLDEGRRQMQDILENYASHSDADDPTILDVTLTTSGYERGEYRAGIVSADHEYGAARLATDSGTEEREKVESVRQEGDVLYEIAYIQQELHDFFDELEEALELAEDDRQTTSGLRDTYFELEDQFEEIDELAEGVEPFASGYVVEKVDQIEAEIDILDQLVSGIMTLFTTFSVEEALDARREFASILDTVSNENAYPPEGEVDDDLVGHVERWHDLADEIANPDD